MIARKAEQKRKRVTAIPFLIEMWSEHPPSAAERLLMAMVAAAGMMVAVLAPRGSGMPRWAGALTAVGALLAYFGGMWVLLSIPRVQRWVRDGR